MWELSVRSFTNPTSPTAVGHFPYDLQLLDFMTQHDVADSAEYNFWSILSLSMTFKIISVVNMYKGSNNGATLANTFYNAPSNSAPFETYVGFFRNITSQDECAALAVDDLANRQALMETGKYKRLYFNGKPVTFIWRQSTGQRGCYSQTPTNSATTLSAAFSSILDQGNNPHGIDFLWFDSTHYCNVTNGDQATIRIQCTFNAACVLESRKPANT